MKSTTIQGEHILEYQWRLKQKFDRRYSYLESTTFPKYIQWYKDYFWYTGDRDRAMKAAKVKNFSNIHYPLIRPIVDTFHASSYDAQTIIKAIAQSYDDQPKTDIAQATINWALMSSKNKKVIKEVDFVTQLNGEGFFEMRPETYQNKRVIKNGKTMVEKYDDVFEITLNYIDEFELIYNPFVSNWYLWEKFIRTISSVEEAKRKYSFFFEPMSEEDQDNWVIIKGISNELWKKILEAPYRWSDKDYTNVKDLLRNTYVNTGSIASKTVVSVLPELNVSPWEMNVNLDYKIDTKQKIVEVVKYMDLEEMVLIFNGYVVYRWPNTFWCVPMYRTQFGNIPWTHNQDGIAQLLFHLQRQGNAFVNRWVDMLNGMSNPIIMMDKGIFWTDTTDTLQLDGRKVYQRMAGKSFERMQLVDPQATQSLLWGLNWIDAQAKESVGLNSYSLGGEGKVERVGGAPQIKQAIHKARQSAFIENKNETLWWLAYDTMRFLQEYMPDNYPIMLYDEKWQVDWKTLKKDDIAGRFTFEFDASSMKSLEDLQRRSELIQVLPMISDPAMRAVFEHEIAKSMSINILDREKMQQVVKDQIDMEVYKQGLIAQAQAAAQPQQSTQVAPQQALPPMPTEQLPVVPEETDEEYYARTGELR